MKATCKLPSLVIMNEEPYVNRLIETMLTEICERLSASAASLYLREGSRITLKDTVIPKSTQNIDVLKTQPVSSLECTAGNAQPHHPCQEECDLQKQIFDAGYKSALCVPLNLGETTIGALCALSTQPKTFTQQDRNFLMARAKRLALALHHITYFPGLGEEWASFADFQAHIQKRHFVWATSGLQGKKEETNTVLDTVLALEGLKDFEDSPQLPGLLPKGISLPTLRRVCDHLTPLQGPITRKSLSKALGFSAVTAGQYLSYLESLGILVKRVSYGRSGRPPLVYVLAKTRKAKD